MKKLAQIKSQPSLFILATSALACIALLAPNAFGVTPPPDGGYPGGNTAEGQNALFHRTTGGFNAGLGWYSLFRDTTGSYNTGVGAGSLALNTGDSNAAIGAGALLLNNHQPYNTAVGASALLNNTGDSNTAVGASAGLNATTGSGNVYIGSGMRGFTGESNHTYIRNISSTTVSGGATDYVTVNLQTGLLGHLTSSRRYKEEIKPMDKASETLYWLKPVTYRFKKEIDTSQSLDYGLLAEEVAEVDPNLAIRDGKGQIESVRYTAINAMLLNEFLKEHRRMERLEAELEAVNKRLKEQDSKIDRVSHQVEMSTLGPEVAMNEQ